MGNEQVVGHYGNESLLARVENVLKQADLGEGTLTLSDLAPLDQFHVRGMAATEEMADGLQLAAGATLLDIGSGLGGPARYLAAARGCRVTGIDLSQPFVEVAQMLTERTGLADRVTFVTGDALALPFPDARFDDAWTQHVAMNIADRAGLYGEIYRVLKPGGRLAIYDIVTGNGAPLIFPVPWARTSEISFLQTPDVMKETLIAAGFTVISWEDKTADGLAWYAGAQAAQQLNRGGGPLSIGVVMGPEFGEMAMNLGRNLKEGRIRLTQAILQKA